MRYFFYGTLTDEDVLRRVFGRRRLARLSRRAATLHGFCRCAMKGALYPTIVASPEGRVRGLLVGPVSKVAADLLARYEGRAYQRRRVRVEVAPGRHVGALTFLCQDPTRAARREWRIEAWRPQDKARFLRRIRTWIATDG